MAVQIQLRRDTTANWTSTDPTLAQGEVGLEIDTTKFKMGDGIKAWTALGYYTGAGLSALLDLTDFPDAYTSAARKPLSVNAAANAVEFGTEIFLTPKSSSSGPEGTIFYCSDDNSVYVGVE